MKLCKIEMGEMLLRDLNKYVNICKRELDSVGIPYKNPDKWIASGKLKRSLGYCALSYNSQREKRKGLISSVPKIVISKRILNDNFPEKYLKETIIHELIHTCNGCGNHGREFQRMAKHVNQELGYSVGTYASREETDYYNQLYSQKENKYFIKCPECGRRWGFKIKGKSYKHPEQYRCSKCKATLIQAN